MTRTMALMMGAMFMSAFAFGEVTRTTIPGHPVGFYVDALPEDCPLPTHAYRVGYRLAKHGTAGIPFILWPERVEPLQSTAGWWLEVLVPQEAEGTYEFRAGDGIYRVRVVRADVPPAEADFGFYYQRARLPEPYRDLIWEQRHFEQMAQHGHNTVTLYDYAEYSEQPSWEDTDTDERIRVAMLSGLVSADHPVIVLPGSITPAIGRTLQDTKPEGWPELVFYGPDEPSVGAVPAAARWTRTWHAEGLRMATALTAASVQVNPSAWDIWLVRHGDLIRRLQALAATNDAELGTYDHRMRGTNYRLNRFYAGLYTWAHYLKANYLWAYTHDPNIGVTEDSANIDIPHGYVLPHPEGPLPTIGLKGRRDGILDYRLLRAVEQQCPEARQFLAELRAQVPRESYDDPVAGYYWDTPDTYDPMPNVDFETLRQRLLGYLED
jgi:hypothetical protein